VTDPFPDPLAAEVIVSQLLLSLAVQAHPAPALTRIVPVDSSAPTLSDSGEMLKAHGVGVGVGVGVGGGPGVGTGPGGTGDGVGDGVGAGVGASVAASC